MKRWPVLMSAALAACTPAAAQDVFTGIGRSIDGDSLYVGDREVRLFGIDAPEYHQTCTRDGRTWACGADAAKQLSTFVTNKQVRCDQVDTDEHGRIVARCSVGSVDVNRIMVATGYAIAYRHYSLDYVSAEESAKVNKRGLWAGTFEMPREYRVEEGTASRPRSNGNKSRTRTSSGASSRDWQARASGNCKIKGNRNRKGQWIYHLPGMPYYDQTRPEEIFCTEAEAQAAGYRRAKVR